MWLEKGKEEEMIAKHKAPPPPKASMSSARSGIDSLRPDLDDDQSTQLAP